VLEFDHLSIDRLGIDGVALKNLDGDGPALSIAEQAVNDLPGFLTRYTPCALRVIGTTEM
jgi:hypothetical protein